MGLTAANVLRGGANQPKAGAVGAQRLRNASKAVRKEGQPAVGAKGDSLTVLDNDNVCVGVVRVGDLDRGEGRAGQLGNVAQDNANLGAIVACLNELALGDTLQHRQPSGVGQGYCRSLLYNQH